MGVNYLEMFEKLANRNLRVRQSRCVVVRNRHTQCRRCAESCTSGAITVDANNNEILIEPANCIGCGTCTSVCPTGALSSLNPTDTQLVSDCLETASKIEGNTLAIACEKAIARAKGALDPEKVVSVVCLGRVEESLLAILAVNGTSKPYLVCGDCETCELASGCDVAKDVIESFNSIMKAWGSAARAKLTNKFPISAAKDKDSSFDASKRAAFGLAKDGAKGLLSETLVAALKSDDSKKEESRFLKVGENGTLPQFVPVHRNLLLNSLASMDLPPDGALKSRLWGRVEVDTETCIACKACMMFCPTGAIQIKDMAESSSKLLEHRAGHCIKCHCCEDICLQHAIKIYDDIEVSDITEDRVQSFPISAETNKVVPGNMAQTMRNLLGMKTITD